jgi:hypothetical protein
MSNHTPHLILFCTSLTSIFVAFFDDEACYEKDNITTTTTTTKGEEG